MVILIACLGFVNRDTKLLTKFQCLLFVTQKVEYSLEFLLTKIKILYEKVYMFLLHMKSFAAYYAHTVLICELS